MPVLHCISSFEGTYKKLQDIAISSFYFLLFCNFSELDSKLSTKKILVTNSSFLTDSPKPTPHPLNGKNTQT